MSNPATGPSKLGTKISSYSLVPPTGKFKGYVFNERTNSLAGPFDQGITAISSKDNSDQLIAVTEHRKIISTSTLDLNNPEFPEVTYEPKLGTPFSFGRNKGVIASDKGAFLYRGRYLSSPYASPISGNGEVTDPMFFEDCYLSIAETNWMHFGSEAAEKEVYRVDLNFHKNSYGHLWLYLQNDSGKVSGQYKGKLKETVKVFTNLRGRRFKIKMFIATHESYPWAMREMAVGYNIGKSF